VSELAIRVERVGKQYVRGHRRESHPTVREAFTRFVRRLATPGRGRERQERFWALEDVSFEIKHGESVGIIGANGAGKSTVLKILSRITEPTCGVADLYGRVSALLEVGTGFHLELTGRENVFLNGAILGMPRAEIRKKFDAIVDFAELEAFIDTPVKHYSSGMYLRLAFAVAAHLEPDILIVDEVLAVGDVRFQKRCLRKMESAAETGRTVLFVSHNMADITSLCERVILLDGGTVVRDGPAAEVVGTYLASRLGTTAVREWPDQATAPGAHVVRLRAIRVRGDGGAVTDTFDVREAVWVEMDYDVRTDGHVIHTGFRLTNEHGVNVFTVRDRDPACHRPRPAGRYRTTTRIPGGLLNEGPLFVSPVCDAIEPFARQFFEQEAIAFYVVDGPRDAAGQRTFRGRATGAIHPRLRWSTTLVDAVATAPSEGR
jgi:lipopolysaccharide transport system ATP-binding protein